MGYQGQLRSVTDELLSTVGVQLRPEDRLILRERGFYTRGRRIPTQEDLALQLGCSQVHISNLENRLIRQIRQATKRARQASNASERQADMLVSLYDAIAAEAEQAGHNIDEIARRSVAGDEAA